MAFNKSIQFLNHIVKSNISNLSNYDILACNKDTNRVMTYQLSTLVDTIYEHETENNNYFTDFKQLNKNLCTFITTSCAINTDSLNDNLSNIYDMYHIVDITHYLSDCYHFINDITKKIAIIEQSFQKITIEYSKAENISAFLSSNIDFGDINSISEKLLTCCNDINNTYNNIYQQYEHHLSTIASKTNINANTLIVTYKKLNDIEQIINENNNFFPTKPKELIEIACDVIQISNYTYVETSVVHSRNYKTINDKQATKDYTHYKLQPIDIITHTISNVDNCEIRYITSKSNANPDLDNMIIYQTIQDNGSIIINYDISHCKQAEESTNNNDHIYKYNNICMYKPKSETEINTQLSVYYSIVKKTQRKRK